MSEKLNFNVVFRSFDARRLSLAKSQVNINNISTLSSVTKDGNRMNVGFVFSSNFEPNVGIVRIEGDLTLDGSEEVIDEAIVEWEKSEHASLPKELAEKVHNTILSNCIIEASMLARDLKLPMPIPMPHVSLNKDSVAQDTSYIR